MINSPTRYDPPHDCGPDIIFQDESLLVVNKPAGLLSVPGRGADKEDCLALRLQKHYPDALSVHRLDMDTSGLLVFARGKKMHNRLSELFRERQVDKRYVAIIAGRLNSADGAVDLPLGADWPNRPRQKVDFTGGKHSLTRYRLLAHDAAANTSRVELEPVTGRTHQLRLHMAAIGHPIVGDKLYGTNSATSIQRLMLHAGMLSFVHPFCAAPLTLACDAPF